MMVLGEDGYLWSYEVLMELSYGKRLEGDGGFFLDTRDLWWGIVSGLDFVMTFRVEIKPSRTPFIIL